MQQQYSNNNSSHQNPQYLLLLPWLLQFQLALVFIMKFILWSPPACFGFQTPNLIIDFQNISECNGKMSGACSINQSDPISSCMPPQIKLEHLWGSTCISCTWHNARDYGSKQIQSNKGMHSPRMKLFTIVVINLCMAITIIYPTWLVIDTVNTSVHMCKCLRYLNSVQNYSAAMCGCKLKIPWRGNYEPYFPL